MDANNIWIVKSNKRSPSPTPFADQPAVKMTKTEEKKAEEMEESKTQNDSIPFIMFYSTFDFEDRSKLDAALKAKFPGKYNPVDTCMSRAAFAMSDFPGFVRDVKACAEEKQIDLRRLMAVPDPGLALCMDFEEDEVQENHTDSLGRSLSWKDTPHWMRPSSYANYA